MFITDNFLEMKEVLDIGLVKEIAAMKDNFACLTYNNEILFWQAGDSSIQMLEKEPNLQS